MSKKEQSPVVLIHCEKLFEAEMTVSALEDAGVPAYQAPAKSSANTIIPQSMGLNENGFDVFVLENHLEKAKEILKGITVSDDTECCADSEENVEYSGDVPEYVVPESSVEKQKGESSGSGAVMTVIALVAVAATVWLSDWLIAWLQSLLGCA